MKRALSRLAALQVAHPLWFVLTGLLLAGLSLPWVAKLSIDTSMIALLPEDRPSVQDLRLAENRLRSNKSLTIAVESASGNVEGMRRFVDALAARLGEYPADEIGVVDASVRPYQDFVEENAYLFVPIEDLRALRVAVEEEGNAARLEANPLYINFDEGSEDETESVEDVVERIRARGDRQEARFPDGYYQHAEGKLIALFVRTGVGASPVSTARVLSVVRQEIDALNPTTFGADIEVSLAGDLIVQGEEQAAITQELGIALLITLSGVLCIVLLYFRRLRVLPLLGMGLIPGVIVSFAFAAVSIGTLNLTTAFLGSVLLGNGINPSIIWLARYFEERKGGANVEDAVHGTHLAVSTATLVASGAAAAAYASLMITDFRGFRDFGVIGGVGMVLSWISAMTLLPASTVLSEKLRPLRFNPDARSFSLMTPVASLLRSAPGAVLIVSAVACLVSFALVGQAIADDPMEYDFRQLRSERGPDSSPARRVGGRVNRILSSAMQGRGIAMLGRTQEDMPVLRERLDALRGEGEVFDGYHSIENLLPKDAEAKIVILNDIREELLSLRPHLNDERRASVDEYMPPEDLRAPTIQDIPDAAARLFVERDGQRGLILVISEADAESIWDGRYLIRWTETLRQIRYADGTSPPLLGQAPVFADMIDAVYQDMPKAIGGALLVTMMLAFFGFRRFKDRIAALAALGMGVLWMAAAMAAAGMKLHFLNFIAFPITFGNGVDYPVNVLRRYENEAARGDEHAILDAVTHSGGAVLLCSMTTIIGYSSLLVSDNLAMNSFGLAMAISEVTCCASAILSVPAFILWRARRRTPATPHTP